jgi:8-oxo-dGTP diphosphatase
LSEIPVRPKRSSTNTVFITDTEIEVLERAICGFDASEINEALAITASFRQHTCDWSDPKIAEFRDDEKKFGKKEPNSTPWHVHRPMHEGTPCCIMSADGQLVANFGDGGNGVNTQLANAQRIVGAVNYCSGLPWEDLDRGQNGHPSPQKGRDYTGVAVAFTCVSAIDGRYLGSRRGKDCARGTGQWDWGGGKLEFGEGFDMAARREIFEEYGCRSILMKQMPPLSNTYSFDDGVERHWCCIPYVVLVSPAEVKLMEPDKMMELAWFQDLDDLPQERFVTIQAWMANEEYKDLVRAAAGDLRMQYALESGS